MMLATMIILSAFLSGHSELSPEKHVPIEEFSKSDHLEWRIINDGVMGGLSKSQMTITDDGTGIFSGEVSLDNNGGFASTRAAVGTPPDGIDRLVLRVKGDGLKYSIRLRTNSRFDGPSYVAEFDTKKDEWTTHEVMLSEFEYQFRGYTMNDSPALVGEDIRQVGILIANKQEGPFRIELDFIHGQLSE